MKRELLEGSKGVQFWTLL